MQANKSAAHPPRPNPAKANTAAEFGNTEQRNGDDRIVMAGDGQSETEREYGRRPPSLAHALPRGGRDRQKTDQHSVGAGLQRV